MTCSRRMVLLCCTATSGGATSFFGSDGHAWLIDPSVHGGHPEEDLAMLALFGPVPARVLTAYGEVRPLAAGWRERVELFQLYPLLVHSVLFGGGYRTQAETIARHSVTLLSGMP